MRNFDMRAAFKVLVQGHDLVDQQLRPQGDRTGKQLASPIRAALSLVRVIGEHDGPPST
ncbi:MAG: hypothetical protein Q8L71_11400 [Thiobacillus sp.]|nr:hypothetical protein [Thiobacillus sp.]